MKILITGNLGYVGPAVIQRLRECFSGATLIGLDMGFFAHCLTAPEMVSRAQVDIQYFADVRNPPDEVLQDIDAIVYLAAISNDPMGALFEDVTAKVNHHAAYSLAVKAKARGVQSFIFASSCSVYGFAEGARDEDSPLNPLTAYAKSKLGAEKDLSGLADERFVVTCLRFATACGMSERLRLDLVLNDFVASALVNGEIIILSDGTPWRPLIHIKDMAKAIEWGIRRRKSQNGGEALSVNVGSNQWNYQVRQLADAVAQVIPGTTISINEGAQPDRRSYQVNFERFMKLAPEFQPSIDLHAAIVELKDGMTAINFHDKDFRNSELIRLNQLKRLKAAELITENLDWVAEKADSIVA
ncbi:NAD-dependent epimerase/dehydratase family protein [Candidatus Nitrospira allomarina]|uniref:SDR family oxidoreductase n=1 Tax=Candidatus Nitrospira allomarina TaxID=3020900 RepID=A0AA96GAE9_9BACT|nr:SDR family oxidoreductase [Candidatus Nitrospira allomarina]WNM58148.1 SDR family oxidoreductase [Candidatus Nitrospira allomarina]